MNGRIEAVGRTFHLRGHRQESFALMVPERSLKPGATRVEVFEVVGGTKLRLLAACLAVVEARSSARRSGRA